MADANKRQEGGDHYGGGTYQHWDWVCATRMHYLPACASKYVFRHRNKNGLEDLQKALHYIDKAEEVGVMGCFVPTRFAAFWQFASLNDVTLAEAEICWYLMEGNWQAAREEVELLCQIISE